MKILEQSQSRLSFEIRPVGLMILCVGLFLLFFFLGFGLRTFLPSLSGLVGFQGVPGLTNMPSSPGPTLLGYASVIPLFVAVVFLKTRRLTFDRGTGQIQIATRGLLGRGEKTYPMAAFQGASLAASRSGNNGTTYRAKLHFSDENGLVSVTPYGTSGSGPAKTVALINGWFGTAAAPGAMPLSGLSALSGGATVLSGDQAEQAIAALEKLGIKVRKQD